MKEALQYSDKPVQQVLGEFTGYELYSRPESLGGFTVLEAFQWDAAIKLGAQTRISSNGELSEDARTYNAKYVPLLQGELTPEIQMSTCTQ